MHTSISLNEITNEQLSKQSSEIKQYRRSF